MRQEGELAGTHDGERGLPRGRSGLPADEVREAQRERLLRAVIAAVHTAGFHNVTVADIVRGARVSRAAFYVDMPVAGPGAVRQIEAAQHGFARLNRAWHQRARLDHPDWPAVPYQAYYALAGAATELVRFEVRRGPIDAAGGLEDTLVALHLAVLAARPWT